ncbi:hypothetical protein M3Y99_00908700 [Aphelenchoides fujianensis]|nr:hypothetical protein M3Y99_00908700 [Aphelenchoides fujianensis]
MHFAKLTIRYDLQRSKIKEFLDPLLTAMREVAKLPSSLELVIIEDVKSKCRNHASLAEAERDYREFGGWVFSTDFTMVVCPTNMLSKEEIECKEGKEALLAQLVASTSFAR